MVKTSRFTIILASVLFLWLVGSTPTLLEVIKDILTHETDLRDDSRVLIIMPWITIVVIGLFFALAILMSLLEGFLREEVEITPSRWFKRGK